MWIATRYGFFSVVCARKSVTSREINPEMLMVRARRRQHLESLITAMPDIAVRGEIMQSAGTDYPFRIFVSKTRWTTIMTKLVDDLDYGNFKNEAHKLNDVKYDAFLGATWSLGLRLEDRGRSYLDEPVDLTEPDEEPPHDIDEMLAELQEMTQLKIPKTGTDGRHRKAAQKAKRR